MILSLGPHFSGQRPPNPGVLRLALVLHAWGGGGGGGGQSLFLSFSELLEALYIPWLVDPY